MERTRCYVYKLHQKRFHYDIRRKVFTVRVIIH